jgi:predicted O-methyltransferase YrrM
MRLHVAVGEVQSKNVNACEDERCDRFVAARARTQRRDDLGVPHAPSLQSEVPTEMSHFDPAAGAVLEALTRGLGARRVLEIGTGTGESALWIARALPEDGMLITLERDPSCAIQARTELERAGVGQRVSVMIGDASRYLHKISGPFDLVVQHVGDAQRDAMRPRLLQLLRERGLLATTGTGEGGEIVLTMKR